MEKIVVMIEIKVTFYLEGRRKNKKLFGKPSSEYVLFDNGKKSRIWVKSNIWGDLIECDEKIE